MVFLRREKLKRNAMCRVTIEVDQEALRSINPELSNTASIRRWAQELINKRIQQMKFNESDTMSIEDAREMTLAAVREEYAQL